jgi:hypothetical protein
VEEDEEEDACMSYEEEDTQDGKQTLVKLVIKVRERTDDLLVQARDLAHLHLIGQAHISKTLASH